MIPIVVTSIFGLLTLAIAAQSTCNSTLSINPPVNLPFKENQDVKLVTPRRTYDKNIPFHIELVSYSKNITAFYLRAFNRNDSLVVGQFMTSYTDGDVTIYSCANHSDTAAENPTDFKSRSSVNIYWNFKEKKTQLPNVIYFVATVRLENDSDLINVSTFEITSKPNEECYTNSGIDYRGSVHKTLSGIECQRWDSNISIAFNTTAENYPDADLSSNFCRSINNQSSPWCYINSTRSTNISEACDIPKCVDDLPDYFLSFGKHVGDTTLVNNNSGYISLNATFGTWRDYKIYKNGLITFGLNETLNFTQPSGNPFSRLTKKPTPDLGLVATFWTQFESEFVYYRETNDVSTLLHIRDEAKNLQNIDFNTTSVLIVTWYSPNQNNSFNVSTNAFQLVLATDGSRAKMFLNYYFPDTWPVALSAKTSYLVGNSVHVTIREEIANAHAMSVYLTTRSNVGRAGKWLLNLKQPIVKYLKKYSKPKSDEKFRVPSATNSNSSTNTKKDDVDNSKNIDVKGNDKVDESNNNDAESADDVENNADDLNILDDMTNDVDQKINAGMINPVGDVTNLDDYDSKDVEPRENEDEINLEDSELECRVSKCNGVGQCEENSEGCICDPGYTGLTCSFVINECSSFPCINGGVCVDGINEYSCDCPSPFSGVNCEINLEEVNCISDPDCFCGEENLGNNAFGFITWPNTQRNTLSMMHCPFPTNENAYRQCNTIGNWENVDYSSCERLGETSIALQKLFFTAITQENATLVFEAIAGITASGSRDLSAYDMSNIAFTLRRALDVVNDLPAKDARNILNALSSISLSSKEQRRIAGNLTSSNANFVEVVEESSKKLTFSGNSTITVKSDLVDMSISQAVESEVNFFLKLNGQSGIDKSQSTDIQASIQIPSSISNKDRLQFAVYKNSTFFDFVRADDFVEDSRFNISSQVISASVGDSALKNLNEPVVITLSHLSISRSASVYCVFWVPPSNIGGDGSWSDEGCEVVERRLNQTICQCDHLTNFAFLLDIHGSLDQLPEIHNFILMIITYVGCGLSVLGLVVTVLSYLCIGKLRKDLPSKILISLCASLIGGNVFYLLLRISDDNTISCIAIPALLHYMLLSAFVWMGLEALNMYIALVRVFNTYYRQYFLKISVFGWGVPLLIVAVTMALHFSVEPSYIFFPNQNLCWIRRDIAYYVLIGPFGIVFLFNIVIFYLVLRQLLDIGSRKIQRKDSRYFKKPVKRENARKLRGAIGLLALLGITWGLSFGIFGGAAIAFSYLFVILNSFQGFWIFIFHCIMKKEIWNCWNSRNIRKESITDRRTRLNGNFHASRNTSIASRTHSTSSLKLSSSSDKQILPKPEVYKPIDYNDTSSRLVRMIPRPVICPPSANASTQTDIPASDDPKKYRIITSEGIVTDNFYGKYTPSPGTNVSNDSGAYSDEASI